MADTENRDTDDYYAWLCIGRDVSNIVFIARSPFASPVFIQENSSFSLPVNLTIVFSVQNYFVETECPKLFGA